MKIILFFKIHNAYLRKFFTIKLQFKHCCITKERINTIVNNQKCFKSQYHPKNMLERYPNEMHFFG